MIDGAAQTLWAQVWAADPSHAVLAAALELQSLAAVKALVHLGCCIDPDLEAVLLPVGRADDLARVVPEACSRCLMLADNHGAVPYDGLARIADVIAIPLDGGACLSLEGATAAVGDFTIVDGRCAIVSNGLHFLHRHVLRAEAVEAPEHVAAQLLPPPDRFETLLIERAAFEWRLSEQPVIVPSTEQRIACIDSRELALWITKAMREKRPVRRAPAVLMPKETA